MDAALFDRLEAKLKTAGPSAAIDDLIADLKERKEYHSLFYALLMKKRHELGVSPIPTGSNQDLPDKVHEAFEEAIRDAARTVGQLYLDDGLIPQAWVYFRMIGESGPVAAALKNVQLAPDDDPQPYIEIALHHGVLPTLGFEWVLTRYGMCNAITMMSNELPLSPEDRAACVRRLIRALHEELFERVKAEIERKQGFAPTAKTLAELIEGRDWLFADDFYHIDLSHLNATVQMAMQIPPCEEFKLVRDLCAYGKKLSPRFHFNAEPPFERQYHDYDPFLQALMGENVDAAIAHFKAKLKGEEDDDRSTFPAEVLVNLLLKLGRKDEALDVAKHHLGTTDNLRLSCPNLVELCQQTGRYGVLAEAARAQGNAVNFLAGLIAEQGKK